MGANEAGFGEFEQTVAKKMESLRRVRQWKFPARLIFARRARHSVRAGGEVVRSGAQRTDAVSKLRRDELHESPIVRKFLTKVRDSCNSSLRTPGCETVSTDAPEPAYRFLSVPGWFVSPNTVTVSGSWN